MPVEISNCMVWNGNQQVVQSFVRDITECKKTESSLQASEERFRSIFEDAGLAIAVANQQEILVAANQAYKTLVGYELNELTRMTFRDFTHPDEVEENSDLFQQLVDGTMNQYRLEKRYVHKSGAAIWVRLNVPLFPGTSDTDFAIAMVEDITDRKQAEERLHQLNSELDHRVQARTQELRVANERLNELDRMKTKFIADVSHELRTPLAVLNTRMYLLQRSTPEKQQEYIHGLERQIERLTQFVDTVFDLSRLTGDTVRNFEPIELNDLIQQTIVALSPRAEAKHLTLTFDPSLNMPNILGHHSQLNQVMTNLIDNALKYTLVGSVVVSTDVWKNEACIMVKDTGIGIPSEDQEHLFDRFYRGEQMGQSNIPGTGLGLAIVKEIIEQHEGRLEVDSQRDVGTSFIVCLPLAKNSETPVETAEE